MNAVNPKQAAIVIIVLVVLAALINASQEHSRPWSARQGLSMPPEQARVPQPAAGKIVADDAAVEHAKYLARYLNTGFARKPGVTTVAIAVASENGTVNRAVGTALASRFNGERAVILSSFFKAEFVSDGLFNDAFAGTGEILKKLDLAGFLDAVLLARQAVRYSVNPPSLENVITANMDLEVTLFPTGGSEVSRTWTFAANGAGFKQEDARAMAEERLIKQIAADTRMSLHQ